MEDQLAELSGSSVSNPEPKMPAVILVGYTTRLTVDEKELIANLEPPASYTGKKAQDWLDKNAVKVIEDAKSTPYTSELDQVAILDEVSGEVCVWSREGREETDKPMCVDIRDWLLTRHPDAWPHTTHRYGAVEAIFVGFEPKTFLDLLGLECVCPGNWEKDEAGNPVPESGILPLSLWYGNADHRDLSGILRCKTNPALLPRALAALQITAPDGWTGPGKDARADVKVGVQIARRVGLL